MTDFERRSVISGIGQSAVGRRLGRTGLDLTIDAALAAIADAGLTPADIDGIATYPGAGGSRRRLLRSGHPRGAGRAAAGGELAHRRDRGGRPARRRRQRRDGGGGRLARHVLVYRTVTESTEQGSGGRLGIGLGGGGRGGGVPRIGGSMQWSIPFRAYSAANWLAMVAQRYFHTYGTTAEQMAMIALNARRNAGLNPLAVYREPMTLEDYRGPHGHHPVPALRLRRPGRRVDGGRGVGGRARRPASTTPWPGSRRWARRCGAARRGTSSTT